MKFMTDPRLLPEGIEDILPDDALDIEALRRRILDLFVTWGYERVTPPLIDYLTTLQIGSGKDLDLQTFKLIDQLSGAMLGIRADMTPQVARIDAHQLGHEWPTRLCYVGTIVHACGDALDKSRTPTQIGSELYGYSGLEGDLEIIKLMLEMLAITGLQEIHIDLGHVGVYRGLVNEAGLTERQITDLFDILQRKSKPELAVFISELDLNDAFKAMFIALPDLNGGREVFAKARQVLVQAGASVQAALDDLEQVSVQLEQVFPHLAMSYDLAELRGYNYHTGIVFAAFVPGYGREIARGGRYDNIGIEFGRERAATGFSADLKVLARLSKNQHETAVSQEKIFAPCDQDEQLGTLIRDLRAQGRTVIQQLTGQVGTAQDYGCTAVIIKDNQSWAIRPR
ncbi:MAG TPA: ATP phosphoribosyltransferase regulatory subunit [Methylococcales bacterium]|jgi:ATP phosphoribosyltransferase regulatory subunit|nr:ATP phosphoribosyltransferase regulatory subunit [Methylococcales bacterium]